MAVRPMCASQDGGGKTENYTGEGRAFPAWPKAVNMLSISWKKQDLGYIDQTHSRVVDGAPGLTA
jgi:hypothetical protein